MPIKKVHPSSPADHPVEVYFSSRVFKVETEVEDRNWSDTFDYSDYRATLCTYALVWLGHRGKPPRIFNRVHNYTGSPRVPRSITFLEPTSYEVERELTEDEQFAWIDCTLIHDVGYRLLAEADPYPMLAAICGPDVLESYYAWEKRTTERAARIEKEYADALAAKATKKRLAEEREEHARTEARDILSKVPQKGSDVTVDGFKGKIFWTGMKKFRGSWNARVGVKSSDGSVVWVDATKLI